jgi:hypothetical protein
VAENAERKQGMKSYRDREEVQHAKQRHPEEVDGNLGPDNLYFARLGRRKEEEYPAAT